tara:strand:+ start:177 stop:302 length:126 start_codon:yes stop_codon:yes gene_type:complete
MRAIGLTTLKKYIKILKEIPNEYLIPSTFLVVRGRVIIIKK